MDCSRDSRFGHEEEYAMRSRRRRGLGVQLGFRRCELGPGDAIAFDYPPHRLWNVGTSPSAGSGSWSDQTANAPR
jgi:hypothetical protein